MSSDPRVDLLRVRIRVAGTSEKPGESLTGSECLLRCVRIKPVVSAICCFQRELDWSETRLTLKPGQPVQGNVVMQRFNSPGTHTITPFRCASGRSHRERC